MISDLKLYIFSSKGHAIKSEQVSRPNGSDNDEDDDEIIAGGKRKRSRIARLVDSDDSDRENESNNNEAVEGSSTSKGSRKTSAPSTTDSPVVKKKIKRDGQASFEEKLKMNLDESQPSSEIRVKDEDTSIIDAPVVFKHNKLDFLKPENIKDKEGRRPSHPDYDPTTLYVPPKYLDSLTPVNWRSMPLE